MRREHCMQLIITDIVDIDIDVDVILSQVAVESGKRSCKTQARLSRKKVSFFVPIPTVGRKNIVAKTFPAK